MSAWSVLTVAALVVAGVVAGIIGTAGGITSLVAYPALLAVGLPPFAANVTNSVALLGSGARSAFRAREQLRDHPSTIRRWLPLTVGASTAGAVLLVVTPVHLFDRIVPFLVLAGGALLLLQPVLDRRRRRRTPTGAAAPTGAVVGGLIGPTVAARVPQSALRLAIAACSVALAGYLFVTVA